MRLAEIKEALTIPIGKASNVGKQVKDARKKLGGDKKKRGEDAVRRWKEAREKGKS